MSWAWTLPLAPPPKLVLVALADEADDRGFCLPNKRRIAERCNITERSVRRMIPASLPPNTISRSRSGARVEIIDPGTNLVIRTVPSLSPG
jgi:hypothetical protein